MIYRTYGKTNKEISLLGFGGMRFPSTNGDYDIDACAELVKKAFDKGVNYFDTAPGYCGKKSEVIMGRAFQEMKGTYYVSTKSGSKNASGLRKDLETSLQRMGKEKIDFFHIWCVLTMEDYENRMKKGGPYEEALKAQQEGLIEHIVISTHCSGEEIKTICESGAYEGITLGYNAVNFPFREKGMQAAYENDMGIVTMNPLGGGIIGENQDFFSFLAEDNETPIEAALRFNAAHPQITCVLPGIDSLDHLMQNIAALENPATISANRKEEIAKKLSSSMDSLCTGCRYCEFCPEDIPISKYLQAYNQKMILNQSRAVGMLKWHWGIDPKGAADCTACGHCETLCTQKLNIIERLEEIATW